jgi:hypothetical protein
MFYIVIILLHNLSHWLRNKPKLGESLFKFAHGADAIDRFAIDVATVKIAIVLMNEISDNTARNRDAHAENVDDDKKLILHHAT